MSEATRLITICEIVDGKAKGIEGTVFDYIMGAPFVFDENDFMGTQLVVDGDLYWGTSPTPHQYGVRIDHDNHLVYFSVLMEGYVANAKRIDMNFLRKFLMSRKYSYSKTDIILVISGLSKTDLFELELVLG